MLKIGGSKAMKSMNEFAAKCDAYEWSILKLTFGIQHPVRHCHPWPLMKLILSVTSDAQWRKRCSNLGSMFNFSIPFETSKTFVRHRCADENSSHFRSLCIWTVLRFAYSRIAMNVPRCCCTKHKKKRKESGEKRRKCKTAKWIRFERRMGRASESRLALCKRNECTNANEFYVDFLFIRICINIHFVFGTSFFLSCSRSFFVCALVSNARHSSPAFSSLSLCPSARWRTLLLLIYWIYYAPFGCLVSNALSAAGIRAACTQTLVYCNWIWMFFFFFWVLIMWKLDSRGDSRCFFSVRSHSALVPHIDWCAGLRPTN